MRFTGLIFILLLTACGGSENDLRLPSNDSEPRSGTVDRSPNQDKSSAPDSVPAQTPTQITRESTPEVIDAEPKEGLPENINTLFWALSLPVSLNHISTFIEQPLTPNSIMGLEQALESDINIFHIDNDGHITIYTLFEITKQNDLGAFHTFECVHIQNHAERWSHLHDNRYRIFNRGQSMEADIYFDDESLSISQRDGHTTYNRFNITLEEIQTYPLCARPITDDLRYSDIKEGNLKLPSELKGLWRVHNTLEPVNIGFSGTRLPHNRIEFIEFDELGNGQSWLYSEENQCFIDLKKRTDTTNSDILFLQITSLNSTTFDHSLFAFNITMQLYNLQRDELTENRDFLYFLYSRHALTTPPSFLERVDIPSTKGKTCEIPEDIYNQLIPVKHIQDIQGVWSLQSQRSEDMQYLEISPDGILTHYDYRGDSVNNASNCYKKVTRSRPSYLSDNLYEETIHFNFNHLISFYVFDNNLPDSDGTRTDQPKDIDLVITSETQQGTLYNRRLKRARQLEKSGLYPLCPSVRNTHAIE